MTTSHEEESAGPQDSSRPAPLPALVDLVRECDDLMSHAWMVRTFVKHSEEAEDYPDLAGLMGIVRTVFDLSRALETRVDDPAAYFHMLRKKIGHLKSAAADFERDAKQVSMHTNFVMAVRSIHVCHRELTRRLEQATALQQAQQQQTQ